MKQFEEWEGFKGRMWKEEINTRDFIQENYTPYDGDASFLAGPTEATDKLWGILQGLQKEERKKGGVLDMDTDIVSSLTSHGPGYISEETKDLEQMVVSKWQKNLVVTMVMNQAKDYMKSLQNIQRLITQLFLMLIHQK